MDSRGFRSGTFLCKFVHENVPVWVHNVCRNKLTIVRRCGNILGFIVDLLEINVGFTFDQLLDDIDQKEIEF